MSTSIDLDYNGDLTSQMTFRRTSFGHYCTIQIVEFVSMVVGLGGQAIVTLLEISQMQR